MSTTILDELIGWKRLFIAAVEQKFRNRLNLIAGTGISLSATDNTTEAQTDLTISSTSTAGHIIQDNGDPMTQRAALNFVGFEVTDTGPATVVTLPGGVETTAGFTMPAVGSNVSISMVTTAGLVAGQVLYLQDAGYMEIVSVDNLTTITGQNIGDVRNAAPGTAIGSGRKLQSAGPQGPAGADGADGTNGTNGTNGETGPTGPSGPIKVTVLSSGSSFVSQSNTTKIEVEMWGGGGGGAGAAGIVA